MALIACPECASEISDKAVSCPQCGCPISADSKVVVYGYTQQFAMNPKVSVFLDGEQVGQVGQGERLEIDLTEDAEVSFKCNMRKAKVRVPSGELTNVKLSWNRITGKMVAQVVDTVTPAR